MTRLHKLGKYKDGFKVIEYCTVCSAEGEALLEDCPGNFPRGVQFKEMTKEEFDEKYGKALDVGRTKAINHRY